MKYWPLTLRGSFLLAAALVMMGTALPLSNPYGIILSALLLAYLTLSTGYIYFFKFRLRGDKFQWSHRQGRAPGSLGRNNIFLSMEEPLPPLSIYIFTLRGRLRSGNKSLYGQGKRVGFSQKASLAIELPLPGTFSCRGRLFLSDLFGFIRTPLTDWLYREIPYYPPLLADVEIPRPSSAENSEETVRTSPSNPERVFMRDYQSGDLARDINWKSSSKFSAIYTRIAPDAADTTTKLTLAVRTKGLAATAEPLQSALLLGLKSFSLTLLAKLLKDYPDSIIVVQAGGQVFTTEEQPLAETAFPFITAMGSQDKEETVVEPGTLVCTTTADGERNLLSTLSPQGLYIIGGGPAPPVAPQAAVKKKVSEEAKPSDLTFSMLKGNCLPLKSFISSFDPRLFRKPKTYSATLPNGNAAPPQGKDQSSHIYVEVCL